MAALVTGIGYVGARLVRYLLDRGEQVVGLDNYFSTDPEAVDELAREPRFIFVEGDVRSEEDVLRAFDRGYRIDTVYHLAAQSSSSALAAPARYTDETNLIGARIVLDQAREAGARTFVFGSSLQVYGRRVEGIVDESSLYGHFADLSHLSKVHVEQLLEMYAHVHGMSCVSARIGLVYGLSPVMKTDERFMTAPNKFCMLAARGEGARLDAGAYFPTSMVHVEDVVRGMVELARGRGDVETGRRGEYAAVNLLGEAASVARVAGVVRRLAAERGIEFEVEQPAEEPAVPEVEFRSAMDGFAPRRSLEEGLREVLDHFMRAGAPSRVFSPGLDAGTSPA